MKLGAINLPAGATRAALTVMPPIKIWREGDGAIPVHALEEIGVTAKRDYWPLVITGVILALALTAKR